MSRVVLTGSQERERVVVAHLCAPQSDGQLGEIGCRTRRLFDPPNRSEGSGRQGSRWWGCSTCAVSKSQTQAPHMPPSTARGDVQSPFRDGLTPLERNSLPVRVPRVRLDHLVGLVVPQPDRRVERRSEEKIRVWREPEARNGGIVFVHEGLEALPRRGVPYPAGMAGGNWSVLLPVRGCRLTTRHSHVAIPRPRDEHRAISAELDRTDRFRVRWQDSQDFA